MFKENKNLTQGGDMVQSLQDFIHSNEALIVGNSGLRALDETLYGGFETGKIYSLVAPPGVGKTMFAVQCFAKSLEFDQPTMFISTEMSMEVLTARLVTRMTGIPEAMILRNKVPAGARGRYEEAMDKLFKKLQASQPVIVDKVNRIEEVLELVLNAKKVFGTPFVILDHMHNLRSKESIYEKISNAAHDIQEYAVNSGVAFLLLAQMSKMDISNGDYEMKGAKGAADVTEVTDVLMVMQRSKLKEPNKGELVITKNRWGEAKAIDIGFTFPNKKIYEYTEGQTKPANVFQGF